MDIHKAIAVLQCNMMQHEPQATPLTDLALEALSKTFDLKGSRSSNSSSSPRRLQVPQKRQGHPHRCRWYSAAAVQEVPKRRSRHGKHMAAIIARQRERQEETLWSFGDVRVCLCFLFWVCVSLQGLLPTNCTTKQGH